MSINLYDSLVPSYTTVLTGLSIVLAKGAEFAVERKIDPSVLLASRLAPDMFALTRQVQIATDNVKGSIARLSGQEVPSWPDTETTFEELHARIAKALELIKVANRADFEGADTRVLSVKVGPTVREFTGADYFFTFAQPNVFFHATTAYAILRHNGVPVGKRNYHGQA